MGKYLYRSTHPCKCTYTTATLIDTIYSDSMYVCMYVCMYLKIFILSM